MNITDEIAALDGETLWSAPRDEGVMHATMRDERDDARQRECDDARQCEIATGDKTALQKPCQLVGLFV